MECITTHRGARSRLPRVLKNRDEKRFTKIVYNNKQYCFKFCMYLMLEMPEAYPAGQFRLFVLNLQ